MKLTNRQQTGDLQMAADKGEYKDFSGVIHWLKNIAVVENANFTLVNDPLTLHCFLHWHDGIWHDGYFSGGIWRNGVWREGYFKSGVWYGGDWHGGTWKRVCGDTWASGRVIDKIVFIFHIINMCRLF